MNIKIDGKDREITQGQTVEDILQEEDSRMPIVVVKINGDYLSKDDWTLELKEGDEMAVIHIIAGG